VRELVEAPLERAAALRPQRAHHLAGLVEALQTLPHRVERKAVGLVLVLLPAGSHAEDETSAGDDVDLCGHLRDDSGMAIGVAEHDGAHAHARHERGERAQRAPRLQRRALTLGIVGHEVVRDARGVPPGGFEMVPELPHAAPGLVAHAREQAEAHWSISLNSTAGGGQMLSSSKNSLCQLKATHWVKRHVSSSICRGENRSRRRAWSRRRNPWTRRGWTSLARAWMPAHARKYARSTT